MATDLDPSGQRTVLDRAGEVLRLRRAAEVEDLELCLAWADLHGLEPSTYVPGGDRLVTLGGGGTPAVRDLSLEELSLARQVHVNATRAAVADALDLRHRLPAVWAATRRLECEPWLARKIARMSRHLDRHAVALVDQSVSVALQQAPARVIAIAEAAIIEADTAAHEAQLEQKRRERGVWLGRLKAADPADPESGRAIQSVYAKVSPAGAHFVDDLVNQIADRLAHDAGLRAQHHPDLPEHPTRGQLRAAAFEWLARPDDVLHVLDETSDEPDESDESGAAAPAPRQKAVVYVHLHESALLAGQGVARAESFGPVLLTRLVDLLGHAHVELKPVIDLNTGASINGYEHPTAMRERAHLRVAGDVFPYAASLSRRLDADHPVPYDPGGPPGQTGDHNIAPLNRHAHRAKTHVGHRVEQLGLSSYLWTSPHGLQHLVCPEGTFPLRSDQVELLRAYHAPAA